MTATRKCAPLAAGAVLPLPIAAAAQVRAEFDLPGIGRPTSQGLLMVAPPLPDALAHGLGSHSIPFRKSSHRSRLRPSCPQRHAADRPFARHYR